MQALKAYAKINMDLKVLGTLPGGFHEIESHMQAISLADEVMIDFVPGGNGLFVQLDIASPLAANPLKEAMQKGDRETAEDLPTDDRNIAVRAAKLFAETFCEGKGGNIWLTIIKRIPVAAGLAGGSADAAAVLYGMYLEAEALGLANFPDPFSKLMPLAEKLGSDVPFCLSNHFGHYAALAKGRGEKLEFTQGADLLLVLDTPNFAVSTKDVYAKWDEVGSGDSDNALEAAALALYPKIQETKDKLKAIDPAPIIVKMSGSGPSCFALFDKDVKLPESFKNKCLHTLC